MKKELLLATVPALFFGMVGLVFVTPVAKASYCPPGRMCPVTPPSRTVPPRPVPPPPSLPPHPSLRCPAGTVPVPGSYPPRCVRETRPLPPPAPTPTPVPPPSNGRAMRGAPARNSSPDEISAANIVNQAMSGLSCAQAGDALRRLSNQLLSMAASSQVPPAPGRPEPDLRRQWREHIRSPQFWSKVWNRMADAYRDCDRSCFDDGLAVGAMSATGYCAASIAVEGLPGIGYLEQPPLPVCETAIHVGCVQNYQSTASQFSGCRPYMQDSFSGIFAEYVSQDCHL